MNFAQRHTPLVDAARTGHPQALERLLRACQPDIRRYAQRHCLVSDVDDAVQETLVILSRRVGSLRVVAAFSGWLLRVVQRECRRLGRKAFGFDPYDEEAVDRWLARHTDDTIRIDLVRALESLPGHYREVILLRDFDGMTIAEMARELALTPAAVKSRLHRARELTREYLLA